MTNYENVFDVAIGIFGRIISALAHGRLRLRDRTRRGTVVSVLLAGFAVETLAAELSVSPVDSVEIDVLVVGAGSAGVPAAIQSGRLGAKTVLVESAPILGGNLTLGGVEHPEAFMKSGGPVAVSGIGLEWTVKSIEMGKGPSLSMNAKGFVPERLNLKRAYDPNTFVCVGEELLAEAGVDLRYYESPIKVESIAG